MSAGLREVIAAIERGFAAGQARVSIRALDPDLGRGLYAGERVDGYVHRPYRVWVDLAERLGARFCTPIRVDDSTVELAFERLDPEARLELDAGIEKYGAASAFARIDKREDPDFVIDLRTALSRAQLPANARVLEVGVNRGDALELVREAVPSAHLVGIDHSASALAVARARFENAEFLEADANALPPLGRFDLILSIGTLQSPGIDDRAVLRTLVQEHLAPRGSIVIGFPNCRYLDGEVQYGARMRNFREPELGLLVKDVAFYRKYLQQHDRQVFVTGRHELLVTAVPYAAGHPRD